MGVCVWVCVVVVGPRRRTYIEMGWEGRESGQVGACDIDALGFLSPCGLNMSHDAQSKERILEKKE